MQLASAHMPLLERLRKGANCVGFLDGAPEPAADVADMLRKAADEIERLRAALKDMLEPYAGVPAKTPYFTEAVAPKIAAARAALDRDQQSGSTSK